MREDTQKILKEFNINSFGNKKNIEKAEKIIDSNESILFICPTNLTIVNVNTKKKTQTPAIAVLTNKKLYFNSQILFNHSTEIIDLNEIKSINSSGNGVTGGTIEIHTTTKSYHMLVSYKKEIMLKIIKIFEKAKNELFTENNTSTANNDIFEKIKNLSDLKEAGILSEAEFQQKKNRITKSNMKI